LAVAGPRNIAVRPQLIPEVDRDESDPETLDTKPNGIEERQGGKAATMRGREMLAERVFDDRYVPRARPSRTKANC